MNKYFSIEKLKQDIFETHFVNILLVIVSGIMIVKGTTSLSGGYLSQNKIHHVLTEFKRLELREEDEVKSVELVKVNSKNFFEIRVIVRDNDGMVASRIKEGLLREGFLYDKKYNRYSKEHGNRNIYENIIRIDNFDSVSKITIECL